MRHVNRPQEVKLLWSRRQPLLVMCIIAAGLFGLLAIGGCSNRRDDRITFQRLDRAAQDVKPASLGTVALDEHYGGGGISSDRPTRRVVVISSETVAALKTNVDQRLQQAGFRQDAASGSWLRTDSGQTVTVLRDLLGPGAVLPDGVQPSSVPGSMSAVVLQFIQA